MSDLEDRSPQSAQSMESVEKALKKALERLNNYENQSRHQNVRIIGLKDSAEGNDSVTFFQEWIPKVLGSGSRLR